MMADELVDKITAQIFIAFHFRKHHAKMQLVKMKKKKEKYEKYGVDFDTMNVFEMQVFLKMLSQKKEDKRIKRFAKEKKR